MLKFGLKWAFMQSSHWISIKQKLYISKSNISTSENNWVKRLVEDFLRTIDVICSPNIKNYLIIPYNLTPVQLTQLLRIAAALLKITRSLELLYSIDIIGIVTFFKNSSWDGTCCLHWFREWDVFLKLYKKIV